MKKIILFVTSFVFYSIILFGQNNDLLWVSHFTGSGTNQPSESVTDASGNIYIAGIFTGTVSQGAFTLTAIGGNDVFIAKYNKNGQMQWLKQIGGATAESVLSIKMSNDNNYIYFPIASNSNPVSFDGTNIAGTGDFDIYIAKFAVDGTYQWAHNSAYGLTQQIASRLYIDNSDNIILTGQFTTSVTFYGGTTTLNSVSPATQIFISKFDGAGTLLWANTLVGDNGFSVIRSISSDATSYYFSGSYAGSLTLDIGVLSNAGNRDMFLYKTNLNGVGTWVRKVVGTGEEYILNHSGDALGYQFVIGYYNSPTLIVDSVGAIPSTQTYANAGSNDIFYACYATDGKLQFARRYGSTGDDQGLSVSANNDHVIIGGYYTGSINFGTYNLTNNLTDAFMVETKRNGTVQVAKRANGASTDITRNCVLAPDSTNIFAGDFISADLNISGKILTNALPGAKDMFLTKFGILTINKAVTGILCDGASTGAIDITCTGDWALPLTYAWSGPSGYTAATEDLSGLSAGWYKVTVTDANFASKVDSAKVSGPSAIYISYTVTNTLCPGAANGAVDLKAIGGTAPYTFSWTGPSGFTAITEDITALAAGTYNVTVTDLNGCTKTGATTVNNPVANVLTPTITNPSCSPGGDGAVLLATSLPATAYLWSNTFTTQNISGLVSGTYSVTVTYGASCTVVGTYLVSNPGAPVVITNVTPLSCSPGNDGAINVFVTGGTLNAPDFDYHYTWSDGPNTSAIRTGLSTGSFTVTATDDAGCSATAATVVLSTPPSPVISFAVTNETCAGGNGEIDLTVTGGAPDYTYLWNDGGSSITEDLINLNGGTYVVVVTDDNGCTSQNGVTVETTPPLTASLDVHEIVIFCESNANGEASVSIQNGVAPYTYAWSGSSSDTSYANDLGVGKSYVTITDFCGTVIVDSIRVTSLSVLLVSITSSSPASCLASANGTAEVNPFSGIPPYSFEWSSSASITNFANDLAPGWQYITVTDYCGSVVDSVEITSMPPLTLSTSLLTQITCAGGSNGSAIVIPTDGVSPFTYAWTGGETTATAVALSAGWKYVTVTDGCGSKLDSVLVTVSSPLSIDITSSTPVSCIGGSNGAATVTLYDGVSPNTYLWSTGGNTATATNLVYGWNYVTVTDVCSSLVDSVQITSLPALTANITFSVPASCPTSADGKASVTVSGAPPYVYVWSNSISTSFIATDLLPGWNYVTVTDLCGSAVDSINISNVPALSIQASTRSIVSCSGGNNGSGIVTTADGGAPFTFLWNTGEVNDTAITLIQGWNYVTVTDVCGSLVDSIEIGVVPAVSARYDKPEGVICFGQSTARIDVIPIDGIAPYTYAWGDTTLTTFNRTNLDAGKYFFTVTDGCNSTFVDSVIINQPGNLSLSLITTSVSFTGLSDGAIDLIVSGGTQPYNYNWSNNVLVEDQTDIKEGVYYITVTDNNGCVISDSSSIVTDSWHIEIYKAFTPNDDGKNDVWNIKYISAYPECEVLIYNEWGIKVFESIGYTTAWDGTNSKGKKLPAATYYYIIDLKDGSKVYTGSVALLK